MSARRIAARAALALAGVLAALLAGELAVRALDLGPRFQVVHRELFQLSADEILGYELRPLAHDGEGRINSAGFRDREHAREKPADVFRIVAVGDSVTFGQPQHPEQSWPEHLERLLAARARGRSFEVLNLGVTGYNVLQVAERLATLGLHYEPDLVLYGYVLNDPQELSIELEALRDLQAAEEGRLRAELGRGALRWLSSSRLFLLLQSSIGGPRQPTPAPEFRHGLDPAYEAFRGGDRRGEFFRALHADVAGRARLELGLDRLAACARSAGVPAVVALFPLLLDPREGPYPLGDVHALVAAEAHERGLDVVDLAPAFARVSGLGGLAADFLHPSDAGACAFALALLEELRRSGRIPAGALAPLRLSALEADDRRLAARLGLREE